jgi:hypothetical protein
VTDQSDIMLPHPHLTAFPEPDTVFADPVERYARHLLPLISIDLAAVDPALKGRVHLVRPIEPCDGNLGDSGEEHFGPYLQRNWLGFRLNASDRYELLGDWRFFGVENTEGKESYDGAREELEEFYEVVHASFAESRAAYETAGQVCRIGYDGKPSPRHALTQLGGTPPLLQSGALEGAHFSATTAGPVTLDGRAYLFVASVPGWNYAEGGADLTRLYFDPVERIALLTFDFT